MNKQISFVEKKTSDPRPANEQNENARVQISL